MQHIALAQGKSTAPGPLRRARIAVAVAAWWSGVRRRRRLRTTARMLHGLCDRTLKDIGLDRSEIDSVIADAGSDRLQRRASRRRGIRT